MRHSLEKVGAISEAEEGHRVGHHPNVASSAIEIRFAPLAVLVHDAEYFVVVALRMRGLVGRVRVVRYADKIKKTRIEGKRKSLGKSLAE